MYKRDIEVARWWVRKWQYNGVAPWVELDLWCLENCKYRVVGSFDTIYFENDADYFAFALKWL